MSDTVCLYHDNCRDGWCAAWLLKKSFPDAELMPVQYGDGLPLEEMYAGERVAVVDFSYPPEEMAVMAAKAKSVVMLDHHESAIRKWDNAYCPSNVSMVLDKSKSGAMLTWEWLQKQSVWPAGDVEIPWLVRYVQDRDLWKFELPESRAVNAAIALLPLTVEAWDHAAGRYWEEFAADGRVLLKADEAYIEKVVRNAAHWSVGSYRTVPVLNTTHLHSEVGNRLSQGFPLSLTYWDDLPAGLRRWSLRSQNDGGADVSKVAEALGGGGHPSAAGANRPLGEDMAAVARIVAAEIERQHGPQLPPSGGDR